MAILTLALRYLKSRWMAHLAVVFLAVSVIAMIVVTSVMAGFQARIKKHVRGTTADLTIRRVDRSPSPRTFALLTEELKGEMAASGGPLVALAPRFATPGLLGSKHATHPRMGTGIRDPQHRVKVIGIEWELDRKVLPWDRLLGTVGAEGYRSVTPSGTDPLTWKPQPGLLLGEILARTLGLRTFSSAFASNQATVFTPSFGVDGDGQPEVTPNNLTFLVPACFDSGRDDHDFHHVYVGRAAFRQLQYGDDPSAPDATHVIARVVSGRDLEEVARGLRDRHPGLVIKTWMDARRTLVTALQVESTVTSAILFFIVVLATLLLLGILHMIVVDKRRDVGILRSMGLSRRATAGVFLTYGGLLGVLGVGLGVGLGLLLVPHLNDVTAWLSRHFGITVFQPGAYRHPDLPTVVDPGKIAIIGVTSLLLTVLAAAVAAWRAASPPPVEGLRYE